MAYGYRTPGSGRKSVPVATRFRKYFIEGKPDECWIWLGSRNTEESGGHGRIRDYVAKRNVLAHRLAYEVHHRVKLEPTVKVLHRCDIGACVNPAHLFLGSQADNMADMKAKGRGHDNRGDGNGNARLTGDDVRYIREQLAKGRSQRSLSLTFRVTARMIGLIARGQAWTHI